MGDGTRALLRATESKGFSARNVTAPGYPAYRPADSAGLVLGATVADLTLRHPTALILQRLHWPRLLPPEAGVGSHASNRILVWHYTTTAPVTLRAGMSKPLQFPKSKAKATSTTSSRRPAKLALGHRLRPAPRRPGLGEMKSVGGPAEDGRPDQGDGRRRAHQVSEIGPVEVWLIVIAERAQADWLRCCLYSIGQIVDMPQSKLDSAGLDLGESCTRRSTADVNVDMPQAKLDSAELGFESARLDLKAS
ncbi:hypothetical protein ON010_g9921 [Phytophthora cinnamomi]|nr:hypothetical protein ON010_g9921 [Phytophthora cinnamomi]